MSENSWVAGAFPASLKTEAAAVAELLPPAVNSYAWPFTVNVEGERLTIPYRINNADTVAVGEPRLTIPMRAYGGDALGWADHGPLISSMAGAVYTRHEDGWVRRRALRMLLGAPLLSPWMIPFIVQLVGEYVVQIVEDIGVGLPDIGVPGSAPHSAFGCYFAENPEVLRLTRARVASYWDCYYRRPYPSFEDYPGRRLIAAFDSAAKSAAAERATAS